MTELEQKIAEGAVRALLEQEEIGGEWLVVLDGKEHQIVPLNGGGIRVTDTSEDGRTVEYALKVTVELTEICG